VVLAPPRASAAAGPAEAPVWRSWSGGGAEVVARRWGGGRGGRAGTSNRFYSRGRRGGSTHVFGHRHRVEDAMPDIESMVPNSIRARPANKRSLSTRWRRERETSGDDLKNLFPSSNTRTTTNTQADPLTARAHGQRQNSASNNLQLAPPRHRHRPGQLTQPAATQLSAQTTTTS